MHVDAGKRHGVLPEGVELRLLGTPVEAVSPVVEQLLQIRDAGPRRPRFERRLVGEAGSREALPQILQDRLGHGKLEGAQLVG